MGRSAFSKRTASCGHFSELPVGLEDDVLASGATLEAPSPDGDPMVELVRAQLAAIALAHVKGIDPSRPRRLSRSIVLK